MTSTKACNKKTIDKRWHVNFFLNNSEYLNFYVAWTRLVPQAVRFLKTKNKNVNNNKH